MARRGSLPAPANDAALNLAPDGIDGPGRSGADCLVSVAVRSAEAIERDDELPGRHAIAAAWLDDAPRPVLPRIAFRLLPLLFLALAACGNGQTRTGDYVGGSAAIECAPFARALTGVALTGAAADWWQQAAGRYRRTRQPEIGSVLVFRRSGRLPYGHVAVVSRVLSRRSILVTQANWVHHHVTEDQPVLDISEDGDWSEVRVWWPPARQMGIAAYGIHGFIRPDHPSEHDRLIAETPAAIRVAEGRE